MSRQPDVAVVGAGIAGASVAFELAERGASVVLLDRGEVAGGTTGLGEGNVLVCDKPEGPERELAVLGRALWRELGERFPEARVTAKGALVLFESRAEAAAAGSPVPDPRGVEPLLAPGVAALHEPGDLQVDPRGLTRAMAARVPVRTGAQVVAAEPGAVDLAGGERLRCGQVVVAAGPWSAQLTGLPVQPRKGQLAALAAPAGAIRHKLVEGAYASAVGAADAALAVAAVVEQTLDGDEVLVGSSRERVGFDARVREDVTRAMVDRAARFVPALRDWPVRRSWCGFRPWLPDGLPAIGELRPGLLVSTGHEGAGVGLGPISGRIVAQLITGEAPDLDPAPFDPARFRP